MNAVCVNRVIYTLHLVTLLEFYQPLRKYTSLLHYYEITIVLYEKRDVWCRVS